LKRSDTPEFIQNFLSDILEKVLTGATEKEVLDFITDFRTNFKVRPGWEKGSPNVPTTLLSIKKKKPKQVKPICPDTFVPALTGIHLKRMYG
jgi:hypothetical protein